MDSKLQIISGQFKGRKLRLPPDARPTQNRARIALFNMLDAGIVENADSLLVWDAFAGSGAFGFECLSRWPGARVILTDVAPSSLRTIRENLACLSVGNRATVVQMDAVAGTEKFGADAGLIFLDPPYREPNLGRSLVARLGKVVQAGTIVVWEQEVGNDVNPDEKIWSVLRDKTYGRARFLIIMKN